MGAFVMGAPLLGACADANHPPPAGSTPALTPPDGGIVIDGTPGGGPPNCGGKTLSAVEDLPTLYFVIDRSGSMSEAIDASGVSKYVAARQAVGALLRSIGHRVRYGAAIYPHANDDDAACGGALQIFPPTRGDAPSDTESGKEGPILFELMRRLGAYLPFGGTPTAAALNGLLPTLSSFGERTMVVLATDGAPNCNPDASCARAECIADIEGAQYQGVRCGDAFSCCDPTVLGPDAGKNCIDSEATEKAVEQLRAKGITTYVIGMPGSEEYGDLLSRLGHAGGAPRSPEAAFYAVANADALTQALFEIGTGVAIDCDIALEDIPPDLTRVNLYFDGNIVPFDAESGWQWSGQDAVALVGQACTTLKSGRIRDVEVVYGCQTVVR